MLEVKGKVSTKDYVGFDFRRIHKFIVRSTGKIKAEREAEVRFVEKNPARDYEVRAKNCTPKELETWLKIVLGPKAQISVREA